MTEARIPAAVQAGKIYLKGSAQDPVLAGIPGVNWDPHWQAWRLPATPFATQNILDTFRQRSDYKLLGGADFRVLVAQAKGVSDLQAIKTAENLPLPGVVRKPYPWKHQLRAYHFAKDLPGGCLALQMACVAGDMEIVTNRAGITRRFTLREAYKRWAAGNWSATWHCRSLLGDRFGQQEIIGIYSSGVKPVVKITLDNGKVLRCTPDHEIARSSWEWTQAGDLKPGDDVICNGERKRPGAIVACQDCGKTRYLPPSAIKRNRSRCWDCHVSKLKSWKGANSPNYKGGKFIDQQGYVRLSSMGDHPRANPAGQVYEHIVVMEKVLGRSIGRDEHVHHLNGVRHDNRPENLEVITPGLHNRHHDVYLRLDGGDTVNGGKVVIIPKIARVVSVEPDGECDTYDVAMKGPFHNFVANGVVVHNCGKTRVAVDIVQNRGHQKTLVVAPASVVQDRVWEENFRKYAVPDYLLVTLDDKAGSVKEKATRAKVALAEGELQGKPVVIITNYESVWRPGFGPTYAEAKDDEKPRILDHGFALKVDWDCIIADEIHRIQAANGKASRFMEKLGKKAKQRLGLTGTPFSSGPLSVYGQYRFLDPTIFGTRHKDFKERYALMGGFQNHQVTGFQNQEELQRKFYSIAFRVETRDVLDLPAEQDIHRYCELGREGKRAYQEMEKDFVARVRQGEVTASNALTKLLRLQQMTSGYARLDDTDHEEGQTVRVDGAKQALLEGVLFDLDVREPVVVFARFKHDLDAIKEAAEKQGRRYAELSGRVKQTAFWREGNADVLGVQIGAGAEGVDLTRAHYCCYYSVGYSLSQWEQSRFRTLRPSQKHPVTYIHLIAKGTIDEKVYHAIGTKAEVVANILGGLR